MKAFSSFSVTEAGQYSISALRAKETDMLSIYVNRRRIAWDEERNAAELSVQSITLRKNDFVESTGYLTVTLNADSSVS